MRLAIKRLIPTTRILGWTFVIYFIIAAVSRYAYLNKPIAVIIKNEIHEGRSMLKLRLKACVLDIRHENAFASDMAEIVIAAFLRHKLVTPEQLALAKS